MPRYLNNPRPQTVKALRYRKASRGRKVAVVFAVPWAEKFLKYQVHGGSSSKKKPVPVDKYKNKFGNLPRTATRRKRAYHVKSGGKEYVFIRTGKRKTYLMATWSDKRSYWKQWPFYKIARRVVRQQFPIKYRAAFRRKAPGLFR